MKTILKWGDSNKKVMKLVPKFGKTVTFDLPAYKSADGFKVCPGAGACAAVCYAQQGNYNFPNVKRNQEHNLAMARKNLRSFVRAAIADLKALKAKLVRVHSSGDFFSQAYVNAWFRIARALPGVRFYAYTKSFVGFDVFSNKPDNFAITQSEGSLRDDLIDPSKSHARIFADARARIDAGYAPGNTSDERAVRAKDGTKIGLEYHGVKKLTDAQTKFFGGKRRK